MGNIMIDERSGFLKKEKGLYNTFTATDDLISSVTKKGEKLYNQTDLYNRFFTSKKYESLWSPTKFNENLKDLIG